MKLEKQEARARLADMPVVRLATADEVGQPHIVAATFVLEGDSIFTAVDSKPKGSRDLKRVRNVRANPRVSVLADHYEDDWTQLWWARADGTAVVLEDEEEMARPIGLLQGKYWQYKENRPGGPVIAVTVDRWTGWAYGR